MTHPELVETEIAPPGGARPAGDAGAIVERSAQQVLDAIADAVAREGSASSSALATIDGARPEADVPAVGLMVRRRSDRRRSSQPESSQPDEQTVLDDLASASDDLRRAARNVREGFLKLADIEIRKAIGIPPEAPAAQRREDPGTRRRATDGTATGAGGDGATSPQPRAPAPGELYEGTVQLLVMADGNVQRIVQFVDELCQMPQFRMLRMTGSRQQDGAEISLGLREPLPLARIVASMPNVVRVDVPSADEAAADGGIGVTVHLAPSEEEDLDLALMEPPIEPEA